MGILEMDFERSLGVPFFHSSSHSIMLWARRSFLTFSNLRIKYEFIFLALSALIVAQLLICCLNDKSAHIKLI